MLPTAVEAITNTENFGPQTEEKKENMPSIQTSQCE